MEGDCCRPIHTKAWPKAQEVMYAEKHMRKEPERQSWDRAHPFTFLLSAQMEEGALSVSKELIVISKMGHIHNN